ncbi:MAG: hypothetical protein IKA08_01100 [Alphaproteobacteria bacterium]|nr:hypothetical protein [Alphaproteobacteria bacterium]
MADTIWHTNTERPRKGAEILCIGHNDDGDFVIYGTASHYEDTFCIVGEIEVDYASDIDKWCYIQDLLALLQKVDSYK